MPKPNTKELHFYPGEHQVIWVVNGKAVIKAEGWGGEEPAKGVNYGQMKPQRTTPGRYVIYSYAPYTTKTWPLSNLAWGTKLSVDPTGQFVLYADGGANPVWKKLEDVIPGATLAWIKLTYSQYYGNSGKFDADGDGVPDIWVFNDFGAWAVRYFKDKNNNRKLDANESLSGEMFHTTPDNEAQVAQSQAVTMESSHGCIHLNPVQREQLHAAGAFLKGTSLIIHQYNEKVPASLH